jgi:hypothetical protein
VLPRLPRRHDRVARDQRLDAACPQCADELGRRRGGEDAGLPARREVQDRAVLGDDRVEELRAGEHEPQVGKPPARDEQEPAPGLARALERLDRACVDPAALREGAVVVARERAVAQGASSAKPQAALDVARRVPPRPRVASNL